MYVNMKHDFPQKGLIKIIAKYFVDYRSSTHLHPKM